MNGVPVRISARKGGGGRGGVVKFSLPCHTRSKNGSVRQQKGEGEGGGGVFVIKRN